MSERAVAELCRAFGPYEALVKGIQERWEPHCRVEVGSREVLFKAPGSSRSLKTAVRACPYEYGRRGPALLFKRESFPENSGLYGFIRDHFAVRPSGPGENHEGWTVHLSEIEEEDLDLLVATAMRSLGVRTGSVA